MDSAVRQHNQRRQAPASNGDAQAKLERAAVRQQIKEALRQDEPDLRLVQRLMALDVELTLAAEDARGARDVGQAHELASNFLKGRSPDASTEDDGFDWGLGPATGDTAQPACDSAQDVTASEKGGPSYSPDVVRHAIELLTTGHGQSETARRLGVSRRTVIRWQKKYLDDGAPLPGATEGASDEERDAGDAGG